MRRHALALAVMILPLGVVPIRSARAQAVAPAASKSADLLCEVEGGATIRKLAPDGSRVVAGQVVCEFDTAAIREASLNQKLEVQKAEADLESARLLTEAAAVAIKEEEALHKLQMEESAGTIAIGEAEVDLARMTLEAARKEKAPTVELKRYEIEVAKAELAVAHQKASRTILVEFTASRRQRELRVAFERARAEESSRTNRLARERDRLARFDRRLKQAGKVVAPSEGILVYPKTGAKVEEGAAVRERQLIARIVPR